MESDRESGPRLCMKWTSRAGLKRGLVAYAATKLEALFDPVPDAAWRTSVVAFFTEMDELDRDCREALRRYNRSKVAARAIFAKLDMPIKFTVDGFERLPPSGRMLLSALIDGRKQIGHALEDATRTRTEVDWIPPTLHTRGFVAHVFETCALVDTMPVPEMRWGTRRPRERYKLADLELAYVHAFAFPEDTLEGVDKADPLDRTAAGYLEDERRRIKKAREHFCEEKASVPRSGRSPRRLVLPRFT